MSRQHDRPVSAVFGETSRFRETDITVQGKLDGARQYAGKLIAVHKRFAERPDADAAALNKCAWLLLTCDPADMPDPAAALTAATRANEMSGGTSAGFLDTLTLAYHRTGDTEKAREIQRRAISLLPSGESPLRSDLEGHVADYGSAPEEN